MALKDWKKGDFINYEAEFIKKNIAITLTNNQTQLVHIQKPWHLTIEKRRPYDELFYRNFKTKSQALKYAKAYMRKH